MARRVRFDHDGGVGPEPMGPRRSGRRFVVAVGLGLLILTAGLALAFALWRGRHEALAGFGARTVAPVLDPLAETVPTGVEPDEWRRVVGQARDLLLALTASGALDRGQMVRLADDLARRVADATPATAAPTLGRIWTEQEDRAGPVLTRARRFDLAATLHDLARLDPPGVPADDWALAVVTTRAMLAAASEPARMPTADRGALRDALARRLEAVEPENAPAALADVWKLVGPRCPPGFAPPATLARPPDPRE